MTTLREKLDASVEHVRYLKTERVKSARRRNETDIHAVVEGWRGDERVVVLMPSQIARDVALNAARIVALGFGADAISLTTEGWAVAGSAATGATEESVKTNPFTGRPWGPGDMQRAVEQHGALTSGLIRETLTTFVVNRAGDMVGTASPYRIVEGKGYRPFHVEWDENDPAFGRILDDREEGSRAEGVVPEALVRFMNEADLSTRAARFGDLFSSLAEADRLTNPSAVRAAMDVAVVKALPGIGYEGAALLMSDDPEAQAVIDERLARGRGGRRG